MNLPEIGYDGVFPPVCVSDLPLKGFEIISMMQIIVVMKSTHCDRSSINVCKLLFNTQDKLRSAHRLQGGPFSLMIHLICFSMSHLLHTF
jgi:hypothetical protein